MARATERVPAEFLLAAIESAAPSIDQAADLEQRMGQLGVVCYLFSVVWAMLLAREAGHRPWVSRWRATAVGSAAFVQALHAAISRPELLHGNLRRNPRLVVNTVVGIVTTHLIHGNAPPGVLLTPDGGLRDNYLVQSAALTPYPRDIVAAWVASSAASFRVERDAVDRRTRHLRLSHQIGYQFALPLSMQALLTGVWRSRERSEAARAERLRNEAKAGVEMGAHRATTAAHDYCSQTLQAFANDPDSPHVGRALQQAVDRLEDVLAGRPASARLDDQINECIAGYEPLGLHADRDIATIGALSPSGRIAIITALNQGLANVLAHSDDRHPTVRAFVDTAGTTHLIVRNRTHSPYRGGAEDSFGISALRDALTQSAGTLGYDDVAGHTCLHVRVPEPPNPPS